MREPYDIIKTARVTEKGTALAEKHNQYVFEVDKKATKQEIKFAVQQIFKKSVLSVNTFNVKGKVKRSRLGKAVNTGARKKAIVTLKEGDKLEFV